MQGDMKRNPGGECLSGLDNCSAQPATTQNKNKHLDNINYR
jgi:hypothetical protein